ncbi:MAG: energy transducer TonB, partial [Gammaproteobacteria bacterium]
AVLNQRPTALQSADLWPKGTHVPNAGEVTLTFCIEADGSLDHVKVTSAKPSAVFDQAAWKVLTVWQYWPRMVHGKPVATCNVETTIQFRRTHQRLLWAKSGS